VVSEGTIVDIKQPTLAPSSEGWTQPQHTSRGPVHASATGESRAIFVRSRRHGDDEQRLSAALRMLKRFIMETPVRSFSFRRPQIFIAKAGKSVVTGICKPGPTFVSGLARSGAPHGLQGDDMCVNLVLTAQIPTNSDSCLQPDRKESSAKTRIFTQTQRNSE